MRNEVFNAFFPQNGEESRWAESDAWHDYECFQYPHHQDQSDLILNTDSNWPEKRSSSRRIYVEACLGANLLPNHLTLACLLHHSTSQQHVSFACAFCQELCVQCEPGLRTYRKQCSSLAKRKGHGAHSGVRVGVWTWRPLSIQTPDISRGKDACDFTWMSKRFIVEINTILDNQPIREVDFFPLHVVVSRHVQLKLPIERIKKTTSWQNQKKLVFLRQAEEWYSTVACREQLLVSNTAVVAEAEKWLVFASITSAHNRLLICTPWEASLFAAWLMIYGIKTIIYQSDRDMVIWGFATCGQNSGTAQERVCCASDMVAGDTCRVFWRSSNFRNGGGREILHSDEPSALYWTKRWLRPLSLDIGINHCAKNLPRSTPWIQGKDFVWTRNRFCVKRHSRWGRMQTPFWCFLQKEEARGGWHQKKMLQSLKIAACGIYDCKAEIH